MNPPALTQFRRQHGRRIGVALALLASLGFVFFSITRLLNAQRNTAALNVTIQRLSREVDLMGRELNFTNAPQTFEELRDTEQSLLVSASGLTNWVEELQRQGVPLVLEIGAQLGTPFKGALADRGLEIVPVTVTLTPPKDVSAARSTYQRLLQFLHHVSLQTPRVDLVDLEIATGPGGIEGATAVLNVWVGEAVPVVASTGPAGKGEDQP